MLNTPVLFLIFNRPETTKIVFEQIRLAKPKQLFIVADGAREGNVRDRVRCEEAKNFVIGRIDWDCQVKTLFRTTNLGCGAGVSEAINWFFEHVSQGIILEDDCLPSQDFFIFCEQMLEKFGEDETVFHISGCNLNEKKYGELPFYFSKYANIWGWATWRRAWQHYQFNVKQIFKTHSVIKRHIKDPFERKFWISVYRVLALRNLDTWDYQWILIVLKNNAVCINSNYNLISNIGFNDDATHTKYEGTQGNRLLESMVWHGLNKNFLKKIDTSADLELLKNIHGISNRGYFNFFIFRFKNLLHKLKLVN